MDGWIYKQHPASLAIQRTTYHTYGKNNVATLLPASPVTLSAVLSSLVSTLGHFEVVVCQPAAPFSFVSRSLTVGDRDSCSACEDRH